MCKVVSISYKEAIGNDRWPLQIVQDTFAFGEDVPLRILSRNTLLNGDLTSLLGVSNDKIDDTLAELESRHAFPRVDEHLGTLPNFLLKEGEAPHVSMPPWQFPINNKSLQLALQELEGAVWTTQASNAFLLFREFRHLPEWRLWEIVWLRRAMSKESKDGVWKFEHAYGIPHALLVCRTSPMAPDDQVIVAGPLFAPYRRHVGGEIEKMRVLPAIQRYVGFMEQCEPVTPEREERLLLFSQFHQPVSHTSLHRRSEIITLAFQKLINLQLPTGHREFRQCDHANIGEWILLIVNWERKPPFKLIVQNGLQRPSSGTFPWEYIFVRLDHSISSSAVAHDAYNDANIHSKSLTNIPLIKDLLPYNWLEVHFDRRAGSLTPLKLLPAEKVEASCSMSPNFFVALKEGADISNNDLFESILVDLEDEFLDFTGYTDSRKKAYETSLLSLTQEWMKELFGSVIEQTEFSEENISYKSICTLLNELVSSDYATIYRYDYPKSVLKCLGFHDSSPKSDPLVAENAPLFTITGIDQRNRSHSVCYRAFDHGKPCFVRSFDPVTKKTDPMGGNLLPASENLPSVRSGISVPMQIYGRSWGVMEALGLRPYQFRWADQGLTKQLSDATSPFLYNQFLLTRLHQINRLFFSEFLKEDNLLNTICEHLSSILLSQGASLWIRDPYQLNRYYCRGVFNRPDIAGQLLRDPKSIWFDMQDRDSVSAQVVTTGGTPWMQFALEADKMQYLWQRSFPLQSIQLASQKVNHLTVIRIGSSNNAIASLSLYNYKDAKEKTCYSSDWDGLIRFVSGYIGLLLESFSSQQNIEKVRREYIEHEIKNKVTLLEVRGKELSRMARKYEYSTLITKNHRFGLVLKDLNSYTSSLKDTLEMLTAENLNPAIPASKNPIIVGAERRKKRSPNIFTLYKVFQESLGLVYGMTRKNIHSRPKVLNEDMVRSVRIVMDQENLRFIIDNLLSNSLKYGDQKIGIMCNFEKLAYGISFSVRNASPCLQPGEKYRVTEDRFRGSWAEKISPRDGKGMGLFLVRSICEMYGMGFSYDTEPLKDDICWHIQTVTLPENLLELNDWR
ncbi:MAG: hypothetical protein HQL69_24175 [Magnetococcales bacterium]|nr:hypothetical protein [Magnetococcales bacterium]